MTQSVFEQHEILDRLFIELKRIYLAGQVPHYEQLQKIAPALTTGEYDLVIERFMGYIRTQEIQQLKEQEQQLRQDLPFWPERLSTSVLALEQEFFKGFGRFLSEHDQQIAAAAKFRISQMELLCRDLEEQLRHANSERLRLSEQLKSYDDSVQRLKAAYQTQSSFVQNMAVSSEALALLQRVCSHGAKEQDNNPLLDLRTGSCPELERYAATLPESTKAACAALIKIALDNAVTIAAPVLESDLAVPTELQAAAEAALPAAVLAAPAAGAGTAVTAAAPTTAVEQVAQAAASAAASLKTFALPVQQHSELARMTPVVPGNAPLEAPAGAEGTLGAPVVPGAALKADKDAAPVVSGASEVPVAPSSVFEDKSTGERCQLLFARVVKACNEHLETKESMDLSALDVELVTSQLKEAGVLAPDEEALGRRLVLKTMILGSESLIPSDLKATDEDLISSMPSEQDQFFVRAILSWLNQAAAAAGLAALQPAVPGAAPAALAGVVAGAGVQPDPAVQESAGSSLAELATKTAPSEATAESFIPPAPSIDMTLSDVVPEDQASPEMTALVEAGIKAGLNPNGGPAGVCAVPADSHAAAVIEGADATGQSMGQTVAIPSAQSLADTGAGAAAGDAAPGVTGAVPGEYGSKMEPRSDWNEPLELLNGITPRSLPRDEGTLLQEMAARQENTGDDSVAAFAAASARIESLAPFLHEAGKELKQAQKEINAVLEAHGGHEGKDIRHTATVSRLTPGGRTEIVSEEEQDSDSATSEITSVAKDVLKVAKELERSYVEKDNNEKRHSIFAASSFNRPTPGMTVLGAVPAPVNAPASSTPVPGTASGAGAVAQEGDDLDDFITGNTTESEPLPEVPLNAALKTSQKGAVSVPGSATSDPDDDAFSGPVSSVSTNSSLGAHTTVPATASTAAAAAAVSSAVPGLTPTPGDSTGAVGGSAASGVDTPVAPPEVVKTEMSLNTAIYQTVAHKEPDGGVREYRPLATPMSDNTAIIRTPVTSGAAHPNTGASVSGSSGHITTSIMAGDGSVISAVESPKNGDSSLNTVIKRGQPLPVSESTPGQATPSFAAVMAANSKADKDWIGSANTAILRSQSTETPYQSTTDDKAAPDVKTIITAGICQEVTAAESTPTAYHTDSTGKEEQNNALPSPASTVTSESSDAPSTQYAAVNYKAQVGKEADAAAKEGSKSKDRAVGNADTGNKTANEQEKGFNFKARNSLSKDDRKRFELFCLMIDSKLQERQVMLSQLLKKNESSSARYKNMKHFYQRTIDDLCRKERLPKSMKKALEERMHYELRQEKFAEPVNVLVSPFQPQKKVNPLAVLLDQAAQNNRSDQVKTQEQQPEQAQPDALPDTDAPANTDTAVDTAASDTAVAAEAKADADETAAAAAAAANTAATATETIGNEDTAENDADDEAATESMEEDSAAEAAGEASCSTSFSVIMDESESADNACDEGSSDNQDKFSLGEESGADEAGFDEDKAGNNWNETGDFHLVNSFSVVDDESAETENFSQNIDELSDLILERLTAPDTPPEQDRDHQDSAHLDNLTALEDAKTLEDADGIREGNDSAEKTAKNSEESQDKSNDAAQSSNYQKVTFAPVDDAADSADTDVVADGTDAADDAEGTAADAAASSDETTEDNAADSTKTQGAGAADSVLSAAGTVASDTAVSVSADKSEAAAGNAEAKQYESDKVHEAAADNSEGQHTAAESAAVESAAETALSQEDSTAEGNNTDSNAESGMCLSEDDHHDEEALEIESAADYSRDNQQEMPQNQPASSTTAVSVDTAAGLSPLAQAMDASQWYHLPDPLAVVAQSEVKGTEAVYQEASPKSAGPAADADELQVPSALTAFALLQELASAYQNKEQQHTIDSTDTLQELVSAQDVVASSQLNEPESELESVAETTARAESKQNNARSAAITAINEAAADNIADKSVPANDPGNETDADSTTDTVPDEVLTQVLTLPESGQKLALSALAPSPDVSEDGADTSSSETAEGTEVLEAAESAEVAAAADANAEADSGEAVTSTVIATANEGTVYSNAETAAETAAAENAYEAGSEQIKSVTADIDTVDSEHHDPEAAEVSAITDTNVADAATASSDTAEAAAGITEGSEDNKTSADVLTAPVASETKIPVQWADLTQSQAHTPVAEKHVMAGAVGQAQVQVAPVPGVTAAGAVSGNNGTAVTPGNTVVQTQASAAGNMPGAMPTGGTMPVNGAMNGSVPFMPGMMPGAVPGAVPGTGMTSQPWMMAQMQGIPQFKANGTMSMMPPVAGMGMSGMMPMMSSYGVMPFGTLANGAVSGGALPGSMPGAVLGAAVAGTPMSGTQVPGAMLSQPNTQNMKAQGTMTPASFVGMPTNQSAIPGFNSMMSPSGARNGMMPVMQNMPGVIAGMRAGTGAGGKVPSAMSQVSVIAGAVVPVNPMVGNGMKQMTGNMPHTSGASGAGTLTGGHMGAAFPGMGFVPSMPLPHGFKRRHAGSATTGTAGVAGAGAAAAGAAGTAGAGAAGISGASAVAGAGAGTGADAAHVSMGHIRWMSPESVGNSNSGSGSD